jgi:hypothetical protein
MIPVKVVRRDGYSALIEWRDQNKDLHRGFLPFDAVVDGEFCAQSELDMAISYGELWEKVELKASSEQLAQNLRNVGIWTKEDLRARPQEATGAIMATYGVDFAQLLKVVGG